MFKISFGIRIVHSVDRVLKLIVSSRNALLPVIPFRGCRRANSSKSWASLPQPFKPNDYTTRFTLIIRNWSRVKGLVLVLDDWPFVAAIVTGILLHTEYARAEKEAERARECRYRAQLPWPCVVRI